MPPGFALDRVALGLDGVAFAPDRVAVTRQSCSGAQDTRHGFGVKIGRMADACDESGQGVPFSDKRLAAIAARQHGVVSVEQLRKLGLEPSGARKRADRGRLHRIHRGVYALIPRGLLKREGLWMAAVLACGEKAALSHRSGAALQGLRDHGHTTVEVTVPSSARSRPGITIHRSRTLASSDVIRVKNIPCTTVARTLLDLADVVNRRQLERALDQAEVSNRFDLRALGDQPIATQRAARR